MKVARLRESDCLRCQAFCHGRPSLMMALRMVSSLRMVATVATILGSYSGGMSDAFFETQVWLVALIIRAGTP
ncbi:hypothetical protein AMK05_PB00174 (plasmid) [Rhizobium sp. N324]|nr:hypothetical protein AMK05_PB00174 [Rhizobium sp. N324]